MVNIYKKFEDFIGNVTNGFSLIGPFVIENKDKFYPAFVSFKYASYNIKNIKLSYLQNDELIIEDFEFKKEAKKRASKKDKTKQIDCYFDFLDTLDFENITLEDSNKINSLLLDSLTNSYEQDLIKQILLKKNSK